MLQNNLTPEQSAAMEGFIVAFNNVNDNNVGLEAMKLIAKTTLVDGMNNVPEETKAVINNSRMELINSILLEGETTMQQQEQVIDYTKLSHQELLEVISKLQDKDEAEGYSNPKTDALINGAKSAFNTVTGIDYKSYINGARDTVGGSIITGGTLLETFSNEVVNTVESVLQSAVKITAEVSRSAVGLSCYGIKSVGNIIKSPESRVDISMYHSDALNALKNSFKNTNANEYDYQVKFEDEII